MFASVFVSRHLSLCRELNKGQIKKKNSLRENA